MRDACVTYSGPKFNGVIGSKDGKTSNSYSVKTYKDKMRDHMIKNGMWDMFYLPDPCNEDLSWDIFYNHSRFPLKHVTKMITEMKGDFTIIDAYGLQNLE